MERRYFEQSMTGTMVESDMLGEINEKEYWEIVETFYPTEKSYLRRKEAMELVRCVQGYDKEGAPIDPSNPKARFANDLHATLADLLEFEDYEDIRFYTAVPNTHLDVKHGIDGFFDIDELMGDSKKTITVTLDVSLLEKATHKADVLIWAPRDGLTPDVPNYKARLEEIAYDIITIFEKKKAAFS